MSTGEQSGGGISGGGGRPPCRLVALDGNGTLLQDDGATVGEYTRNVLGRVQARGIPVVLVTGRSLEKARPTLELAGLEQYAITENGARAMRIQDGHALYELWLVGPEAAEPIRRVRARFPDCSFCQLAGGGSMIEASHPWLQREGEAKEVAQKLFPLTVPDVVEALSTGTHKAAKSYVTVESSADFAATMSEIQEAAGEGWSVRVIKQLLPGGVANTCEVQSTRINKADGLAALCKEIGVPIENVWAFGDDANDARMLSEAGWGIRMANHLPGLAGVGDDVTCRTNQEDGVAYYLEEHLLRDSPVG